MTEPLQEGSLWRVKRKYQICPRDSKLADLDENDIIMVASCVKAPHSLQKWDMLIIHGEKVLEVQDVKFELWDLYNERIK